MPYGPEGRAKPKAKKRRRATPRPAPRPAPVRARPISQQRTGPARPRPNKPAPRYSRPAPRTQPGPIRATERRKAERFKRTPKYRGAIRAAQRTRSIPERQARGQRAAARVQGRRAGSVEDAVILHDLVTRNRRLWGEQRARATSPGFSQADRRRVARYGPTLAKLIARTHDEQTTSPGEAVGSAVAKSLKFLLPATSGIGASARRLPKGVRNRLDVELSGGGDVARKAADITKDIIENASIYSTGAGPGVGVTNKALGRKGRTGLAAVTAPSQVRLKDTPPLVRRTFEDLLNFPATAVPSMYVPAKAVVEASRGNTKPAEDFAKDVQQNDPLYALITGKPKKAARLAAEHPGFTALEVAGAKGTIGRGLGRAMRAVPGPTRRMASTLRAPRVLPGTATREERSYSPDVTTKAAQVAWERKQSRKAQRLRRQAARIEAENPTGDGSPPQRAVELLQQANKVDPFRMKRHQTQRRVDDRMMVNESIRRVHRDQASNDAERAQAAAKNPAVVLVAQNIVRADKDQLRSYLRQLEGEHDGLGKAQQLANRTLRKEISQVLKKRDLDGVEEAARRYADVVNPRTDRLVELGLLDAAQAERARLIPYAVQNMGARWNPDTKRVEGPSGESLTNEVVRAHMDDNPHLAALDDPAFVTQAPNMRGARNFFIGNTLEAPNMGRAGRTGEATIKGTYDASPEVLTEGAVRMQGLIDAAEGFQRTIGEFAHRDSLGKIKTRQDAQRLADDIAVETGVVWKPVRINPFAGRQEQLAALLDDIADSVTKGPESVDAPDSIHETLLDALQGKDGEGPWALLPEEVVNRLVQHQRTLNASPSARAFQTVSQAFRQTVLSTSPTWLVGNTAEAALRAGVARAGPRSWVTARGISIPTGRGRSITLVQGALTRLKREDPEAYEELVARATGGGHYGATARMHIRRDSTQFKDSRMLAPMAKTLGAFWRTPGPKQAAGLWHRWTDLVFRQVNGRIESEFQAAMLGKALRKSPLMDGQLIKMGNKAVEQAARGLRDTNEQARFGHEVERMYGKYNGFSPGMRWAIATYTPFIAWTLNAFKFVYSVLPRDHPTITALIASTEMATEEWRKDQGLDLFMNEALPGFLQGSIPTKGGGHQRAPHRYTPFGAFGDPLETLGGAVLPQGSGVLAAFRGEDWKGAKLRDADGNPMDIIGKARVATGSLIDATVPIVGQAKRVIDQGPNALNPVREVKPKESKRKKKGGLEGEIEEALGTSREKSLEDEIKEALGDSSSGPSLEDEIKEALGK